jgi:hypothetical protein
LRRTISFTRAASDASSPSSAVTARFRFARVFLAGAAGVSLASSACACSRARAFRGALALAPATSTAPLFGLGLRGGMVGIRNNPYGS